MRTPSIRYLRFGLAVNCVWHGVGGERVYKASCGKLNHQKLPGQILVGKAPGAWRLPDPSPGPCRRRRRFSSAEKEPQGRGAHATFPGAHRCIQGQVPLTPPQRWSIGRIEGHPNISPAQRQGGWHRVCPLRPVQSLTFVIIKQINGRGRRHSLPFALLHPSRRPSCPGHKGRLHTDETSPGDATLSDGTLAYSL